MLDPAVPAMISRTASDTFNTGTNAIVAVNLKPGRLPVVSINMTSMNNGLIMVWACFAVLAKSDRVSIIAETSTSRGKMTASMRNMLPSEIVLEPNCDVMLSAAPPNPVTTMIPMPARGQDGGRN